MNNYHLNNTVTPKGVKVDVAVSYVLVVAYSNLVLCDATV